MGISNYSEDDFIEIFEQYGPSKASEIMGVTERSVYRRRRNVEKKIGRPLKSPLEPNQKTVVHGEVMFEIDSGIILVGSDAHYWPGPPSTAHRAFVQFCSKMKPEFVIANGDMLDFARLSRFDPLGWEVNPSVKDEIEVAQERMGEIEQAAKGAKLIWPVGNHDFRMEKVVAKVLPEMAGLEGVHLKDWFKKWHPCWRAVFNVDSDPLIVKHRWKGGTYATRNNTLNSGCHMVTGHLHSLRVWHHTDFRGTRYGVDTGTLADPEGQQFTYTEMNPTDWRSGFAVLTFKNGKLLQPELVMKVDEDHVQFRGSVIKV